MAVKPAAADERTRNPLRPRWLSDVIGQENAKALMARAIDSCFERRQPLEHTLLVGPSGTGKSTFSHVLANELGVEVYELEAPVSHDTLLQLRTTMKAGDILKIEEIHQQGIMERRGRGAATQPEVLYAVMEDRTITTQTGVLPFPAITLIGTTTDEGRLPDAFINRFPLRPRLERYSVAEMARIIAWNSDVLEVPLTAAAINVFAKACRGVPREANNLVKNARILYPPGTTLSGQAARDVLGTLGITEDGLTPDMQAMLLFLYASRTVSSDGTVHYQASITTIATAIGKSRDSKAVNLRIEPYLIEKGFVQVQAGVGRRLTDAGLKRAKELERGVPLEER